ncbi:uncharacterized protein N7503_000429 [Penicillium pulvis]|uniref:uncharacterized protein n=1 Tax=Penicillium pulvis TaxID=1562058 RepID=UPI002546F138|nr:uncharacterized protein N7503_000429 [Penicillium pulvis]KAJ5813679.1 hypothetical protein N7503_000429 [Penicillium pulvis]
MFYRISAERGQCSGRATEGENHPSSPSSHPVYCALTLLTPGRATLKRLSPISHPSGTHRTTGRI